MGEWIWVNQTDRGETLRENTRACFSSSFQVENLTQDITLTICAVTKYMVYLNGKQIGCGPIRETEGRLVYDSYELLPLCRKGENHLAVRVWNYGWSTYQSISQEPGLDFTVSQGERTLAASGEGTRCKEDRGYLRYVPKRNVNLGFSDYYDGRLDDLTWIEDSAVADDWPGACLLSGYRMDRTCVRRPIRSFDVREIRPVKMECIQDVSRGCWQITLNTRRAFFGGRRDADETIFSGFIGGTLVAPRNMDGIISFPNRAWNGIIGDFKVDGIVYEVSNSKREIPVSLTGGEHFFLLQVSGKYDDLYCHLELQFPWKVQGKDFFTVGPTAIIRQELDGVGRIYGGLDEFNRMEQHTKEHERIWAADSFSELSETAERITFLNPEDVYEDLYLLSLARTERVEAQYAVTVQDCGILWENQDVTVIGLPKMGDFRRILVDFGDIYVGQLSFTLKASRGTVIDIYGFENDYRKEIDFTIGLNNGIHYVADEGWQTYQCMCRIGMRYGLITVRNAKAPVEIRDFFIRHETYALANLGQFESSDMELNRIFEMCRHTNRLCTEDSFTDSPTYEQAFWLGDAQLSSLLNAWLFGDYAFEQHVQRLAVTAQRNTPLMNALTPTDWNTSIPMWMMNWVISIFETFELSGEQDTVEELYPAMCRALDYYSRFITEEGAFLIHAWNMVDWAAMDIGNHCVVTAHEALLAHCYGLVADYGAETGRLGDANRYHGYQERLVSYIDTALWDEKLKMYRDGWSPETGISKTVSIQTHTMLYLYNGITDGRKEKLVEEYLIHPPEEFLRAGSPFFLYYVYAAYARLGEVPAIFVDIKKRWGDMLRYDSTTCWEVFPGFYENGRTRSYCHSWSATPAYFMLRCLSGVKVLEKGFGKVTFEPCPLPLSWCRCSIPTPYGMISVDWKLENGRYDVYLELPEEISFVPFKGEAVDVRITYLKRK